MRDFRSPHPRVTVKSSLGWVRVRILEVSLTWEQQEGIFQKGQLSVSIGFELSVKEVQSIHARDSDPALELGTVLGIWGGTQKMLKEISVFLYDHLRQSPLSLWSEPLPSPVQSFETVAPTCFPFLQRESPHSALQGPTWSGPSFSLSPRLLQLDFLSTPAPLAFTLFPGCVIPPSHQSHSGTDSSLKTNDINKNHMTYSQASFRASLKHGLPVEASCIPCLKPHVSNTTPVLCHYCSPERSALCKMFNFYLFIVWFHPWIVSSGRVIIFAGFFFLL